MHGIYVYLYICMYVCNTPIAKYYPARCGFTRYILPDKSFCPFNEEKAHCFTKTVGDRSRGKHFKYNTFSYFFTSIGFKRTKLLLNITTTVVIMTFIIFPLSISVEVDVKRCLNGN